MKPRNALRVLVSIAISGGCLYWATKGTDWAEVGRTLLGTVPSYLALMAIASLLTLYVRAVRWRVLLEPLGRFPLEPVLSATAIGFMANMVLPLRMGEVVRPALLGRRTGLGVSAALGSVVLERLLDLMLIVSLFLTLAMFLPGWPALRRGGYVVAAALAGSLATAMVIQRRRERAERWARVLLSSLPRRLRKPGQRLVGGLLDGLGGLRDLRTVGRVLAYSLWLWGTIALTFAFGILALHVRAPLFAGSIAVVVIVAAMVFLPQAPGYVGTWQAGCVAALAIYGVPHDEALGFSLVTWLVQLLTVVGAGGYFLLRERMPLGRIAADAAEED